MKFSVDYETMRLALRQICVGQNIVNYDHAVADIAHQFGMINMTQDLGWETANLWGVSQFEKYGRQVIYIEDDLVMDLLETDCRVPIEAIQYPYKAFYLAFNKSVLPGNKYDGVYVTIGHGNIWMLLVDSKMRAQHESELIQICRPIVDRVVGDITQVFDPGDMMDTLRVNVALWVSKYKLNDGRCICIKTDGFNTAEECVEYYTGFIAEQNQERRRKEEELAQSGDPEAKIMLTVRHYCDTDEDDTRSLETIDPVVLNLVLNACVYIQSGGSKDMVSAIKNTSPDTKKAKKKLEKSGYRGRYMLIGKGYKSEVFSKTVNGVKGLVNGWVRGHSRNQAHGPSHSLRKPIYIKPFRKGVDDGEVHIKKLK